jgi:hypothetical protein
VATGAADNAGTLRNAAAAKIKPVVNREDTLDLIIKIGLMRTDGRRAFYSRNQEKVTVP